MPRQGCSSPLPHLQAQHMIGRFFHPISSAMRGSCSPARNVAMIPLICRRRRHLTVRGGNHAVLSRRKPTPSNDAFANGIARSVPGETFSVLSCSGPQRCHQKLRCGCGRIKTAAVCHQRIEMWTWLDQAQLQEPCNLAFSFPFSLIRKSLKTPISACGALFLLE